MSTDLPHALAAAISRQLESGEPTSFRRVGGGDINLAGVVETSSGDRLFLKWNPAAPVGLFHAEADGLDALRAAADDNVVVPAVRGFGEAEGVSWLLTDYIERGGGRPEGGRHVASEGGQPGWGARLGRGLAAIHRDRGGGFGWSRDNFIGHLPQANAPTEDWASFWRDRRIGPQLRAAAESGHLRGRQLAGLDRLLDRTSEALAGADADGPSLLHGDLWGGNVMEAAAGRAAVYDPAVYRGHREVDLAMSELFGFPGDFLPAYLEVWPVPEAYASHRRDLYQLYYLLAHVNLFGAGYVAPSLAAARRVLAVV